MKMFNGNRKSFLNRKGVTLVELIVAMAILGIISTTFLAMFGNGLKAIYFAGNKSRAVFSAQGDADNKILNLSDTIGTDTIDVDFYNVEDPETYDPYVTKTAKGNIIEGTGTFRERSSVVDTFVP